MKEYIDWLIHLKVTGPMARLLTKFNAKLYYNYITKDNGKPVIYLNLTKASYVKLQVALRICKYLNAVLRGWGFKLNPYYDCVENSDIDGHQCTILWNVDDLSISHIDINVVYGVINQLKQRYDKEASLIVTSGGGYMNTLVLI